MSLQIMPRRRSRLVPVLVSGLWFLIGITVPLAGVAAAILIARAF